MTRLKKIFASVGITGLIAIALFGNLIYMNLRPADPILPGWEEYEAVSFDSRLKAGEPMLVEIYASWCPTCLLQHEAFETLHEEGRAPAIRAVRVDFERDEDFVNAHNMQGTGLLVLFKDGREISRAAGLVTSDKIADFLTSNGVTVASGR